MEYNRHYVEYQNSPTPYPEVNAALKNMAQSIHEVLADKFVGLYVYGSLALGDFDPQKSDIDAVVLTAGPLDADAFAKLEKMHAGLFENGSKWIKEIELCYMPQDELRKYDRAHPPRLRLHEGEMNPNFWQGDDWVLHRHVLREKGVTIAGPELKPMIDPVSAEDISHAVSDGILRNWWGGKVLQKPERLQDGMYQAHAVLAVARALHTLETGELPTKKESAEWAKDNIDEPFKGLVARAAAAKWSGAVLNEQQGVMDFIRYAVNKTRPENLPSLKAAPAGPSR